MPETKRSTEEAKTWFRRLSKRSITTEELRAFYAWRDDSANDSAYRAIEREWARSRVRFVVQPGGGGFSVIDTWTAEPANFARAPQSGISEQDAIDIAELLNRRHQSQDSSTSN